MTGPVIEWRGPAPFYFVATNASITGEIEAHKSAISYGWGVIPAKITIGTVTVSTSLIPKDGCFYVPLKNAVRVPNGIVAGGNVRLLIEI